MEVLQGLVGTQLLFPAVAVAAVLICAAFVFSLGFRTPVEPDFDKSPLLQDDRKQNNKKRKVKDKKPSPNHSSSDSKSDSSKKSPAKEKKEEKVKEAPKPKEKSAEVKVKVEVKKSDDNKRGKKAKAAVDEEKPVDFDEGDWEEVPKKEKKVAKKPKAEEKKESPAKKNKKKKDVEEVKREEAFQPAGEVEVDVRGAADVDEVNRELREKINELQRVLKEAELRDNGLLPEAESTPPPEDMVAEVDQKKPKKEKKKSESGGAADNVKSSDKENIPESQPQQENEQVVVFDELGDTWSESKAPKKNKKKARKE